MSRDKESDQRQIIARLQEVPNIQIACQQAGLPRATFYEWRNTDPLFDAACKKALSRGRDRINDLAESQLVKLIQGSYFPAIMAWLNNNHPNYAVPTKLVREIYKVENSERPQPILPLLVGMTDPVKRQRLEKKFMEVIERDLLEERAKDAKPSIGVRSSPKAAVQTSEKKIQANPRDN